MVQTTSQLRSSEVGGVRAVPPARRSAEAPRHRRGISTTSPLRGSQADLPLTSTLSTLPAFVAGFTRHRRAAAPLFCPYTAVTIFLLFTATPLFSQKQTKKKFRKRVCVNKKAHIYIYHKHIIYIFIFIYHIHISLSYIIYHIWLHLLSKKSICYVC